jgi:aminopeptidase N
MSALLSLTADEARGRAALVTVHSYGIAVDLTGLLEGNELRATSTVRFSCAAPGATTFADCVADVESATLNGRELVGDALLDGRIALDHLDRDNTLRVTSVQRSTDQRTAVHRSVDPADGEVYVWTSFEPDDARRCWACFDQPDLKAPHVFAVDAPASWTVLSNSGDPTVEVIDGSVRRWSFPATPPLSTYVAVVNAGPFFELRSQRGGHDLGLLTRRSLASCLERDADELFAVTEQGLRFFSERFAMPFPQRRYDQVFVPGLGGAMENYGCVTWSDAFVYRNEPSPADRELRATILLHEMAHMWFGDIVTMRWWDDLWLNEAFANWACFWAATEATQFTDAWAGFLARSKQAAYAIDRGPTSHPIRQPARDVAEATAGFDAITYVKGSSVLKQLAAYVGEDAFVAALRAYFAEHAWGNATLDDLMDSIAGTTGRDLSEWTRTWLDTAGHDTLALEPAAQHTMVLRAAGPGGAPPRPHVLDLGCYDRSGERLVRRDRIPLTVAGPDTPVLTRVPAPALLLLNDDDLTFAAVLPPDEQLSVLVAEAGALPTSIGRTVALTTVWDLMLDGRLPASEFVRCATGVLRSETADSVVEPGLDLAVQAARLWAPESGRDRLMAEVADVCLDLAAGSGARRVVALRALAQTAVSEEQLDALRDLAGDDIDLGWRTLARRAALGRLDPDEVPLLSRRDPDPDAGVRAVIVDAARPDPEAKAAAWARIVERRELPSSSVHDAGRAFWQPGQAELLAPYADRYLTALPALNDAGMLAAMGMVRAMFPLVGAGNDFVDRVERAAVGGTLSPAISRGLQEQADRLRRMVSARG